MTGKDLTYCRGCDHLCFGGSHSSDQEEGMCEYCLDTGRARSLICPTGVGCTEHTKFGKEKGRPYGARGKSTRRGVPAPNRKLDYDRARGLYDEGLTDSAIARLCGVSAASVNNWRRKNGLPPNWVRGGSFHV